MHISVAQVDDTYMVVNETLANSPKARGHIIAQPRMSEEVQLWLRTEKGDIRMGIIHSGDIYGVVELNFYRWKNICRVVVGCKGDQIFYCPVCLKLSPKWFRVSNEEWKKYVIPPLQDKVICRPCYDELKKLFPDGWRAVK